MSGQHFITQLDMQLVTNFLRLYAHLCSWHSNDQTCPVVSNLVVFGYAGTSVSMLLVIVAAISESH